MVVKGLALMRIRHGQFHIFLSIEIRQEIKRLKNKTDRLRTQRGQLIFT